ncbi:MAG: 2Fe-2S iron-sulfur cluster-binding protein [Candidatus Competibacteraceae bacterium]|nr:2Fe-2S iron-sulfur cluster-binding protein [Candidatus Competibacteraceae bacterium]
MAKAQLSFTDIGVTVTVPAGTRVIEISDKLNSGIIYGCREGDCATCLMKVVEGMEHLSEPSALEASVLGSTIAGRNPRLACQAQVLGGEIVVRPA